MLKICNVFIINTISVTGKDFFCYCFFVHISWNHTHISGVLKIFCVYVLYVAYFRLCGRETRESLERTLAQLAEVQTSLQKQRQEQEEDNRREKEQEVKLMIDSVAAAELDNLR